MPFRPQGKGAVSSRATHLERAKRDVTFTEASGQAPVYTVVTYKSSEDMQKVIDTGMETSLASTLERLDEPLLILTD